jgi:hypothetical protein
MPVILEVQHGIYYINALTWGGCLKYGSIVSFFLLRLPSVNWRAVQSMSSDMVPPYADDTAVE